MASRGPLRQPLAAARPRLGVKGMPLRFGIAALDAALLPPPDREAGFLTQLYGAPGAGKTALALTAAHQAQAAGLTVAWVGTEPLPTAAMLAWAEVDPHRLVIATQDGRWPGLELATWLTEHAQLVVVDSIAALQGTHVRQSLPAVLALGLPALREAALIHGCHVLLTNQLRDPRLTHPAGTCPSLHQQVDLWIHLVPGEGCYAGGQRIGQHVNYRIVQDGGHPAYWGKSGTFRLFWEEGLRGPGERR